jgi:hypothetical protein
VVDEAELGRLLKRDEGAGEKKLEGSSGEAGNGEGGVEAGGVCDTVGVDDARCQRSVSVEMDVVVGALGEVDLGDAER